MTKASSRLPRSLSRPGVADLGHRPVGGQEDHATAIIMAKVASASPMMSITP